MKFRIRTLAALVTPLAFFALLFFRYTVDELQISRIPISNEFSAYLKSNENFIESYLNYHRYRYFLVPRRFMEGQCTSLNRDCAIFLKAIDAEKILYMPTKNMQSIEDWSVNCSVESGICDIYVSKLGQSLIEEYFSSLKSDTFCEVSFSNDIKFEICTSDQYISGKPIIREMYAKAYYSEILRLMPLINIDTKYFYSSVYYFPMKKFIVDGNEVKNLKFR